MGGEHGGRGGGAHPHDTLHIEKSVVEKTVVIFHERHGCTVSLHNTGDMYPKHQQMSTI